MAFKPARHRQSAGSCKRHQMASTEKIEISVAIEITRLAAVIRSHQHVRKTIHPQERLHGCTRVGMNMSWIIPEFGPAGFDIWCRQPKQPARLKNPEDFRQKVPRVLQMLDQSEANRDILGTVFNGKSLHFKITFINIDPAIIHAPFFERFFKVLIATPQVDNFFPIQKAIAIRDPKHSKQCFDFSLSELVAIMSQKNRFIAVIEISLLIDTHWLGV